MNDASEPDAEQRGTRRAVSRRRGGVGRFLCVALTSFALLIGAAIPAAAAELMRVTFVRHGESAGNASGLIDTSTPGPVLTQKGQLQSQAVVDTLGDKNFDGIYASTMVRTQLTAAPMSQYLRLPIQVLPGLQEIEAGVFEGTPESEAADGYAVFPLAWAFQGNRDLRIHGSINGHEFDDRVDGALGSIYDNGDRNPVVFSHGGAIMFWTMMNAQNLTLAQKIDLLRTAPLGNTDYVVIEGNPEDGWTLVNWNGRLFSPEPTFGAEVRRQLRTLNRQLADSVQQFVGSLASRDFATISTAFNRSVTDVVFSIAKYHRAVRAKVIQDLDTIFKPPAVQTPPEVSALTDIPEAGSETAAGASTPAIESTSEAPATEAVATTRRVSSEADVVEVDAVEESLGDDGIPAAKADRDSDEDALPDLTEDVVSDRDEESAADEREDTAEKSSADSDGADEKASDRSDTESSESRGGSDSDSGSQRDAA